MPARTLRPLLAETADLPVLLKSVADELRLATLRLLKQDAFSVHELTEILATPQPALSHHLKILSTQGWIEARKEGATSYYHRSPQLDAANDLRRSILAAIDAQALDAKTQRALAATYKQRAEHSRVYFARNAPSFASQQARIVAPGTYLAPLLALIERFNGSNRRRCIEVGPGGGELLPELAERFMSVEAIDNSPDMLEQARALAKSAGLTNVKCREADALDLPTKPRTDAILATMVLHHLASPATFFARARHAMGPAATLFLVELCPHQQEWVRESCGDLWLGFEPQTLFDWAEQAGLTAVQSQYLTQRNGFRIQLQVFKESSHGK